MKKVQLLFLFTCIFLNICVKSISVYNIKDLEFPFFYNQKQRVLNTVYYFRTKAEDKTKYVLDSIFWNNIKRKIRRKKTNNKKKNQLKLFLNVPHGNCYLPKLKKHFLDKRKITRKENVRRKRNIVKNVLKNNENDITESNKIEEVERKLEEEVGEKVGEKVREKVGEKEKEESQRISIMKKEDIEIEQMKHIDPICNCYSKNGQNINYVNFMEHLASPFFYETDRNRIFYSYKDIITYIKNNKSNFVLIPSKYKLRKQEKKNTFIDKRLIYIRGRIEKKDKQSKRIFLHLLQSSRTYLTCIYEPKIDEKDEQDTQEKKEEKKEKKRKKKNMNQTMTQNQTQNQIQNQSLNPNYIYSFNSNYNSKKDPVYKYIKNLKNKSIVDITGNIKIHGDLKRKNIPILESWYNKKVIEIVIKQIYCVSPALYDYSIAKEENLSFELNHKWKVEKENEDSKQKDKTEEEGSEHKDEKNEEDLEQKEKTDEESSEQKEKTNEESSEQKEKKDKDVVEQRKKEKEYKGKERNDKKDEIDRLETEEYSSQRKIENTNTIIKGEEFYMHIRNSLQHIVFNIKSDILQQLRNLLCKSNYIETFTSKLVRTGKRGEEGQKYLLNGSEGGCNCFKIENHNLLLAQSPQLYKQMLINFDFDKIFEVNYSYRNEKFHTNKHLNEFLSVDVEQVLFNNYFELVIFMYNILKELNNYIYTNWDEKLQLIHYVQYKNKRKYEKTQIPEFPYILSFCEAKDILNVHVKQQMQNQQENCNYIFDKVHNKYIKILSETEKRKLKQNMYFESRPDDKIENIYYYNKIKKKYHIEMEKPKNLFSEYNSYQYLNNFNTDNIYRSLFLFFEKMYENISKKKHFKQYICKERSNNNTNIHNIYEKTQKTNYFFPNTLDLELVNNKKHKIEIENYSFFKFLYIFKEQEINITEEMESKQKKEKYIYDDDFSQEELNDLYLFMKYNFQTDIFIIDQFPFWLRPFYTLNNVYDLRCTNSFDFIFKGIEIISGSQRITDFALLLFKIFKENKNFNLLHSIETTNFKISHFLNYFQNIINKYSTVYTYLNSFQFASPPHVGLALGFERYLMSALNLVNIRSAIFCS